MNDHFRAGFEKTSATRFKKELARKMFGAKATPKNITGKIRKNLPQFKADVAHGERHVLKKDPIAVLAGQKAQAQAAIAAVPKRSRGLVEYAYKAKTTGNLGRSGDVLQGAKKSRLARSNYLRRKNLTPEQKAKAKITYRQRFRERYI